MPQPFVESSDQKTCKDLMKIVHLLQTIDVDATVTFKYPFVSTACDEYKKASSNVDKTGKGCLIRDFTTEPCIEELQYIQEKNKFMAW